jgi:polyisoprenoid-binding protein YceI
MAPRKRSAMTDDDSTALISPSEGTYRIEPSKSKVHYSGKHMFGMGTVRATFAIKAGELHVADPIGGSEATVTVDAASFTSNISKVRGRPKK